MTRLSAPAGLATALMAIALFAVPSAWAGGAREIVGNAIYQTLGTMLVESATNDDDDLPDYLKPDDRPLFEQDEFDSPASIAPEKYSASDAISNPAFSPEEGITCYPKQESCFKKSGKPDVKWTNRIYAN